MKKSVLFILTLFAISALTACQDSGISSSPDITESTAPDTVSTTISNNVIPDTSSVDETENPPELSYGVPELPDPEATVLYRHKSFWKPIGTVICDGELVFNPDEWDKYSFCSEQDFKDICDTFDAEFQFRDFFYIGPTLRRMVNYRDIQALGEDGYKEKYLINGGYYAISTDGYPFTNLKEAFEVGKELYADFTEDKFKSMQKVISEQNGLLCIPESIAFREGGGNPDYNFNAGRTIAYYNDEAKENVTMLICFAGSAWEYFPYIEVRNYKSENGKWKRNDECVYSEKLTFGSYSKGSFYQKLTGFNWNNTD